MNIFVLDRIPAKCAKYHFDKHVVKMITEHAQMLSTAVRSTGIDAGYKETHVNHPCTKWTRESIDNYFWLLRLTSALHEEWQYRYNHPETKIHKAYQVVLELPKPKLPEKGLTPFALAMPNEYKTDDPVQSYRNYYMSPDKAHIVSWKKREKPEWFK